MKKSILFLLIFLFFIPCIFILGTNQSVYALTYTKLTGGTASASSNSTTASLAFDSSTSTSWGSSASLNNPVTNNLQYYLPSAKVVTKYKVSSAQSGLSWTLKGSNDGSTWTNLHTSSTRNQEITISNTTPYLYYRLSSQGIVIGYATIVLPYYPYPTVTVPVYQLIISELELYAPIPSPPTLSGPTTDADGTYTISWSSVTYATSYKLQERHDSGSWVTIYSGSSTSKSRTSNAPGTWDYRVRATNAAGSSSYSSTKTVLVAPDAPVISSSPTTDYNGSYTISWSSETGAVKYLLQERLNSGSWSTIYNSSGTSKSRTGRTVGTWYYRVKAYGVTWSGYSSTKSVVVKVPLVPTPIGPTTSAYGDTYTISWNAVSEASSYQLQERHDSGSWVTIYSGSSRSKSRTSNAPGTWDYRVRATSAAGSSAYSSIKTVLVAPPIPVISSNPTTDYNGSYTISWGSVSGAVKYLLQERVNSGTWSTIHNASGTSKSVTDRTTAGTWGYRVKAYGVTWSGYSDTKDVDVTVPPVPTPTGPDTDADGTYTISWNAVSEASSYQLQERHDSGSWVTIYNGSSTSKSRTSNAPGTWDYRVRATSAVGSSAYSSIKTVLVPPAVPELSSTGTFSDGFYIVDDDGNYTISWNSVTGASSYVLQEKYYSNGDWSDVPDINGNTDIELEREWGKWYYRVKACGDVICSDYSDEIIVDVPKPPPPEFSKNHPTIDYNGNYLLEWSTVSDATGYHIEETTNIDGSWTELEHEQDTWINITDRSLGTYYYRVKAMPFDEYCSEIISVEVTVPEVPENLNGPGEAANGELFTITWDAVTDAGSYTLQKEYSDSGSWSTVNSYTDTSASISESDPGIWKYHVNACSAVGCSDDSTEITVLVAPPVPGTPSGPDTDHSGAYDISWDTVNGADIYKLQEQFNSGSWNIIYSGSETSITRLRQDAGTWNYRVSACGDTCSNYSDIKSVSVIYFPPTVETFSADSTEIDLGEQVTLSWITTYAETIVIGPNVYSGSYQTGEITVSPAQASTQYTITATGLGGSVSESVTVNLKPVDINYFTASTSLVTSGGHVELNWSVKNAVSVTIGPDNQYSGNAQAGLVDVYPTEDTTYTLTVDGQDGPLTASIFIDVVEELPEKGVTYEYDELGRIKSITRVK